MPAALRRARIASTGSSWSWPDAGLVRGEKIALEPVNESNKSEWWDTWNSRVVEGLGIDRETYEEADRNIEVAGSSARLDGFAVVRALGKDDRLCKVVGGVAVRGNGDGAVELGLWLTPTHRGWGAGVDVLRTAARHWAETGTPVKMMIAPDDDSMTAVAQKAGLEPIAPDDKQQSCIEFRYVT